MVAFADDVSNIVMHSASKKYLQHLCPVTLLGQSHQMVFSIPVTAVVVKAPCPNREFQGIRNDDLLFLCICVWLGTEARRFRDNRFLPTLLLHVRNGP